MLLSDERIFNLIPKINNKNIKNYFIINNKPNFILPYGKYGYNMKKKIKTLFFLFYITRIHKKLAY